MSQHPDHYKIQRLRQLSNLLDNAIKIPGTSLGIGLDPIIGLLPGGGDFLTGLFSAYIVFSAAQLGVSKSTLVRMTSHIIIDTLAGSIPVVGDIFDIAWKANTKNMELLDAHLASPQSVKKADTWFVFLLLTGLIIFIVLMIFLGVGFFYLIFHLLTNK
jgi:hypothetical protein